MCRRSVFADPQETGLAPQLAPRVLHLGCEKKSSLWKHSALALNFWISSGAVLSSTTLSYLCIIIGPLQSVSRILKLLFIFPYFPEGQPTGIVNAKADNDHRVSEGPEISSKLWRSDYFFPPWLALMENDLKFFWGSHWSALSDPILQFWREPFWNLSRGGKNSKITGKILRHEQWKHSIGINHHLFVVCN